MPELILIAHAIVALLCAIEIKVSLGNRERMEHLMRDNWNRRQEDAQWLQDAKSVKKAIEEGNGTSK